MKNIFMLIISEDKDDSSLIGIFDKIEKAERYIKSEFYAGSIPRDCSEFNEQVKKKETKETISYNGKFIPKFLIKIVPLNENLNICFRCPEVRSKINKKDKKESNTELINILEEMKKLYEKAQSFLNQDKDSSIVKRKKLKSS